MSGDAREAGHLGVAYAAYDAALRLRTLKIAMLISIGGIASGVGLDYFVYPEKVWLFAAVRAGLILLLMAVLAVLVQGALVRTRRSLQVVGVFAAVAINGAFCLMIYLTNGPVSPYYAALNLIIMAMSILLPWSMMETGALCLASLLLYAAACLANPYFGPSIFPVLAFNLSFVFITSLVCLTMTFFLSRGRFEDFRLRHQLDRQNRELQDLDRLKTQFFSNVSHELRTPLTLILAPTETLLSQGDALDARVHQGLMLIHRNTLRLLKLINDLLELTRLDQKTDALRLSAFPVGVFTRGIVDSVRHLGLSKNLRVRVEEGDPGLTLTADPSRFEKVLINLLINAIKYTPPGGSITVRWSGTPSEVVVEVTDTGVGIPEADLPRIFDRFHQVRSNAANQTQGVGIGLALAREIVERHGGRIEVSSRVPGGSTFRIHMPSGEGVPAAGLLADPARAEIEEPFERAFRSADRAWRATADGGELPVVGAADGRVVLVADDETDMREYVVNLLAEEYRVVPTQQGSIVAELVERHRPELVILDWMMPGKDGLTVCRDLRSGPAGRDLKIVLLTARIDEESKVEALRSGADDFLTKPFSSVEVKTRVANLLRAGALQKDLRMRNDELAATIAKLEQTETMLIQSEKMNAIGSLSAGLLHEINNPLNYTLTAVRFAGQFRDSLGDEMKEILADIEEGMVRIRDVVTDLKNFAYPEKAGAETDFSLEEVFRAARKIVAGEIENVAVDVDLPSDLVVRGQKTQLMHVFINLLNNAAMALRERPPSGRPTITVRGSAVEEMAIVEVGDNGPGVPADIIHRVFEPFFTTREVGAGMGMGLSICHTIMESHQGSIRAGNRPGGGAVFTITLPLVQEVQKSC